MEFGMFHQFPVVPGQSETDAFEQAFEQVDAAEIDRAVKAVAVATTSGLLAPRQS